MGTKLDASVSLTHLGEGGRMRHASSISMHSCSWCGKRLATPAHLTSPTAADADFGTGPGPDVARICRRIRAKSGPRLGHIWATSGPRLGLSLGLSLLLPGKTVWLGERESLRQSFISAEKMKHCHARGRESVLPATYTVFNDTSGERWLIRTIKITKNRAISKG